MSGRFATPDPEQTSGLFVASCLLTRAPIGAKKEDGTQKFVIRPYTPTSAPDQKGHFDLVGAPAISAFLFLYRLTSNACSLAGGQNPRNGAHKQLHKALLVTALCFR